MTQSTILSRHSLSASARDQAWLAASLSQAARPQSAVSNSAVLSSRKFRSSIDPTGDRRTFPSDFKMLNVKNFGARGDGRTDDTAAIRRALADGRVAGVDYHGRPKAIYFPTGTYLVNNTLDWVGSAVTLQGSGRGSTVIKLKDGATGFTNASAPKAVIKSPAGNRSFRQYIQDLTVDTGRNNAGAIGIDYISNNIGSINRVNIRSGDRRGHSGLNMSRQWPGPSLVKNLRVDGFDRGIYTKHAEYGPTLENITLNNQRVVGILNEGNTLAIRRLTSTNSVPVIRNTESYGSIILLNGTFNGGASNASAIVNERGFLYARSVATTGYRSAISNRGTVVSGRSAGEFVSDRINSLFTSPQRSLNLPIQETPSFEDSNLSQWAKFAPRYYGDVGTLQNTLNSGKSTVYFPAGNYLAHRRTVITVPSNVRRIVGLNSVVNRGPGGGIVFRVQGNSSNPLIIEQFGYGVSVEHASARTVVLKNGFYNYTDAPGAGNLFLEDVGMSSLNIRYPRNVWARQLNIEGPDTKITNNGANLWIFGLKTERAGTVIRTTGGGKTELLGTVIYPVVPFTSAQLAQPAFINENSSQSLVYSVNVYHPSRNYRIQVRETRNGVTRDFFTNQLTRSRMPLFVGYPG